MCPVAHAKRFGPSNHLRSIPALHILREALRASERAREGGSEGGREGGRARRRGEEKGRGESERRAHHQGGDKDFCDLYVKVSAGGRRVFLCENECGRKKSAHLCRQCVVGLSKPFQPAPQTLVRFVRMDASRDREHMSVCCGVND